MRISFTIRVTPRTKKTSNRIVSMGKPCYACKRRPIQRVLPSETFEQFERECMQIAPIIRHKLEDAGVALPIVGPVSVRALIYRDADRGDWNGFTQAIADVLQEPRWSEGRQTRKGMGIIADDVQIQDWDGTRKLKDSARPRIEITITTIDEPLFAAIKEQEYQSRG